MRDLGTAIPIVLALEVRLAALERLAGARGEPAVSIGGLIDGRLLIGRLSALLVGGLLVAGLMLGRRLRLGGRQ